MSSEPTSTSAPAASSHRGRSLAILGVLLVIAAGAVVYFGGFIPAGLPGYQGPVHAYFATAKANTAVVTALNTETGHSAPFTELSSFAPMAPKLTIAGDAIAYLAYNVDEAGVVSCSMYLQAVGSTTPETLGTIPVCDQAHGPNYTLGKLTGTTLELFSSTGESAFATYTRYTLDIPTGAITEQEKVAYDWRCEEGTFYNAAECTPAAKQGNVAYQEFADTHNLSGGKAPKEIVCGKARITRSAQDPNLYTVVTPAGTQTIENTTYAGCSN